MLMLARVAFGSFRTMPFHRETHVVPIVECESCLHTYPRSASPKRCPNCSYVRGAPFHEEVPHEYERFTR